MMANGLFWLILLLILIAVAVKLGQSKAKSNNSSRQRTGTQSLLRKKRNQQSALQVGRASNPYHAVEIKYRFDACKAARSLKGKRFLGGEAPPLPLPDCQAQQCQCRYIHFEDRRQHDRRDPYSQHRMAQFGLSGKFEKNRRIGKDRRQSKE